MWYEANTRELLAQGLFNGEAIDNSSANVVSAGKGRMTCVKGAAGDLVDVDSNAFTLIVYKLDGTHITSSPGTEYTIDDGDLSVLVSIAAE